VETVVFITQLVSGCNLTEFVLKVKTLRLGVAKKKCRQILEGLLLIHAEGIIHRDIKGDNIFVDTSTGDIKIGDFGLATRLDKSDTCSVLGTPEYMAIELFNSTPDNKYTSKVDVYSFGVCAWE